MYTLMVAEVIGSLEAFSTNGALKRLLLLLKVRLSVEVQIHRQAVRLPTELARERLRRSSGRVAGRVSSALVARCVHLEHAGGGEHLAANRTLVGTLSSVRTLMHDQVPLVRVRLPALVTAERRVGRWTRRRALFGLHLDAVHRKLQRLRLRWLELRQVCSKTLPNNSLIMRTVGDNSGEGTCLLQMRVDHFDRDFFETWTTLFERRFAVDKMLAAFLERSTASFD